MLQASVVSDTGGAVDFGAVRITNFGRGRVQQQRVAAAQHRPVISAGIDLQDDDDDDDDEDDENLAQI